MTTTTTTTEPEPEAEFALAGYADPESLLAELQARRQSLALDAQTDDQAAAELAAVEAELADQERTLERSELAQAERDRREAEQRAREDQERREAAHTRAVELQAQRAKAARAVDQAGGRLFASIAKFADVSEAQAQAFQQTGMRQAAAAATPKRIQIEGALDLQRRNAPPAVQRLHCLESLQGYPAHAKPLADAISDLSDWPLPDGDQTIEGA